MIRRLFFWLAGVNVLRLEPGDVVVMRIRKPLECLKYVEAIFSPAKIIFHSGDICDIRVVRGKGIA